MKFLTDILKSFFKSAKLRRLQKIIAPEDFDMQNIGELLMDEKKRARREAALEEFLNMCVEDKGVQVVMLCYGLTREHLREIYKKLSIQLFSSGWINGHCVCLSSIAYLEPLAFLADAKEKHLYWPPVEDQLLRYWAEEIPQGELLRQTRLFQHIQNSRQRRQQLIEQPLHHADDEDDDR